MRPTRRPYLAFVGTHTRVVWATGATDARSQVVRSYAARGFRLRRTELSVRRARRDDLGWLRDAGADRIADELEHALDVA